MCTHLCTQHFQKRLKSHQNNLFKILIANPKITVIFASTKLWRGARVVEEARLESVYTPKGYREFESLPLRGLILLHKKTPRLYL